MTVDLDIAPLDWKLPPHPGEPANGYASRMAALNGVDLAYLASTTGLLATDIRKGGDRALRTVARLGGLDADQTEAMARSTPRLLGRLDAELAGEKIVWAGIHTNFFRYCPHCVAQDLHDAQADVPKVARPWLRLEWLIDQVRSCRIHGVRLMESGRSAPGHAMDFSQIVESDILPRLATLRAGAEPVEPNPFEDWIVRRVSGMRDSGSWLDAMSLRAAVTTCEGLGISARHEGKVRVRDLALRDWSEASLEGYVVASGGPEAIDELLDTLVRRARARGIVDLEATYGYLFVSLNRSLADHAFDSIRDVVREHVFANVPLPVGARVLGGTLDTKRLLNVHEAARAAGTTWPTMRGMLARHGVDCAPRGGLGGGGLTRTTIAFADVEKLIAAHADSVGSTEVSERTGLTDKHLEELVTRGLCPTIDGDVRRARGKLRFRRFDVDALVDKLFAGTVDVTEPGPRQVTVSAARRTAACQVGDVLALVLNGRLAWKGLLGGTRLFTNLLVDADEVRRLVQTQTPRTGYTKREIGGIVPGLGPQVVVSLVARGHLTMAEEFCPVNRRRIPVVTRESVEAFTARYVTVAGVGKARGIAARTALRTLQEADVRAAFDTATVGAWIYERSVVSSLS
ncbi:TniQ family protein [Methylobacterium sp. J-067]|uniref:TniQ family protein n=1 Tax=Methylobacterium sp. J-067 TaxID=2836648 RepID=UPI001FBBCB70|nr:TniQ family protein [Methylobacterium sp. J-067]MCJ2026446.1 TniQ family protein [Methylobacterium sp. J-067]